MLLIALLVMVSSPGPVIYRHRRVGQGGRGFDVLKYRTMLATDAEGAWQITVAGDARITPIGRRLRSSKLDELPQLWNVIRGEMSLVGWRPHVAGYPDRLTGPDAVLIDERPGITGAATLYFRDEERLLSLTDDPKRHYDEVIYPLKVRMDLDYYRAWSLKHDLACLIVTALPAADAWLKVIPSPGDVELPTLAHIEPRDTQEEEASIAA
jgi:lipopolysaccharide/colanic/teichoic acid biosynthesis glycosyltransferase